MSAGIRSSTKWLPLNSNMATVWCLKSRKISVVGFTIRGKQWNCIYKIRRPPLLLRGLNGWIQLDLNGTSTTGIKYSKSCASSTQSMVIAMSNAGMEHWGGGSGIKESVMLLLARQLTWWMPKSKSLRVLGLNGSWMNESIDCWRFTFRIIEPMLITRARPSNIMQHNLLRFPIGLEIGPKTNVVRHQSLEASTIARIIWDVSSCVTTLEVLMF